MLSSLRLIAVFIYFFSSVVYAGQCFINFRALSPGVDSNMIFFDPIKVEVDEKNLKEVNGNLIVSGSTIIDLNRSAENYVKYRESDIKKIDKFEGHSATDNILDVMSRCHKTASDAVAFRKKLNGYIDNPPNAKVKLLHGDWAVGEKTSTAENSKSKDSSSSALSNKQIILSSGNRYDPNSAENITARKKVEDFNERAEKKKAAEEERKKAKNEAVTKARENEERKFCMKRPENRGTCGCSKYFPVDSEQKVCGK